ncbi:ATP-grasp fold amidoligase family protein [Corynebacterium sp. UMB6689]|uniref:ATP-grasp fold amidoligase family protein n=1 Tax=Corynebacterium sp. UMB6689 TaxID=3046341 RepID=UPI00254F55F8|nr:ATP-grasp fold amidoligase family protein [Corynebacterium sp. UMB6689]MDK6813999.1 ATP-grasp fold amidoligase family protein [Corynebacterium sp. UMB6689]
MESNGYEDLEKGIRRKVRALHAAKSDLWKSINTLKQSPDLNDSERKKLLSMAFSPLSNKDVRPRFAMDLERFDIGVSFRSSLAHTRLWKKSIKKNGALIAPGGNSKTSDRHFAAALGVPSPEIFQEKETIDNIELRPNTVLKPEEGSAANGVFYVDEGLGLVSFSSRQRYPSVDEAITELRSERLKDLPVWKLEQAITSDDGNLAHDFKVWSFYGQPGVVQEIKRDPYTQDGNEYFYHRPSGGEFRMNGARKRLETAGFPKILLDYAEKISLASPVPFLRIDFLAADNRVFLGEITPHPGGTYAGQLFDEADKELGKLYYDAEARLYLDLLRGKKFTEYFDCYECGVFGADRT